MTFNEVRQNIRDKKYEYVNGKSERDLYDDLVALHKLDGKDGLVSRMYGMAWEKGHSAGLEEVVSIFKDLVDIYINE